MDRLGVDCLNNTWLPPSQHIVANIGQVGHAAAAGGGGVDCLTLWRRQSAQTQQVLAEIALRSIHEFGNGVSANSCLFFFTSATVMQKLLVAVHIACTLSSKWEMAFEHVASA